MSWGTELWDQFDNIAVHTQKGIDFSEKYSHFIKERCAIENEYASKLKKLVKNYQPKRKEEEDYQFSVTQGFLKMIQEVHDMAGQHETIAENLTTSIIREVHAMLQEIKQERKKYLQDGAKQVNVLQTQLAQLERTKKQYEKAFKESERAQEMFKKADADINLSRAEVEKAKTLSITKQQTCEESKNDYASELQKTNNAQREHYESVMPQIFQQLQDMDERRGCRVQGFVKQSAEIEKAVIPIINTCISGITQASVTMNPSEDSKLVTDRYKSGLHPPGDIPFEDLSNGQPSHNHNNATHTPKSGTIRDRSNHGTVSGGKTKKRGGIFGIFSGSKGAKPMGLPRGKSFSGSFDAIFTSFRTDDTREDYSHLPPNQQKKKLNQKIESLKATIAKDTAERDALLKMRDVYVQNPALGEASSLDKQLEENAQKLDKLNQELQKFEGYLSNADLANQSLSQKNTYHSDESITRSVSEMSMSSGNQNSQPGTPNLRHNQVAKESPDSGVDNERALSYADQDSFDDALEDFPIIGTCRAMYTFDANNEGSIAMKEGEDFSVLEQDQGDGWTRVRRTDGEEGFVPTSYIELSLYEQ